MKTLALAILAFPLLSTPFAHSAETYPVRPIRFVVPTGAGGITDILARMIGQRLGERLGQQIVIDNRPGSNGIVGTQLVATATPDGYTLVMVYPAHPVNPSLVAKLPYDTVKDFAPITMVSAVGLLLVTNPSLPAKSVRELIALAKQQPGRINYGAVGTGSLGHLGAELFRSQTGADITHVAYKSSPQIMTALLSNEISVYFVATMSTAVPLVKAGKIRALGVSSMQSLKILPDVPPIADTVPGFDVKGWNGILGPARMPRPIVAKLSREIAQIVHTAEFTQRLEREGATPIGNTPEQFAAIIRADIAKWAKVIKAAGIRAH
ncbi:MAG: tripartite tricarboxylate transporter substrate binding protein [Betaproteobacteria bacterium]|nr:tripartite tricarboxylate transporter substrate binding protein [Betaproteobacteria bacterium]